MGITEFGQLIAGLGLFLYGMLLMENVIKQVDGRGFKLFFKKHTHTKLSAIFSGTLVTAVMQSSSIVNLMVLSFVGAGMLSMRNALAVVLGANIGGTVNSWLVALLGFKTNIASFALPAIGIAGIAMIVFRSKKIVYPLAKFCMGLGLLFLGLEYMKASMEFVIKDFDITPYLHYNKALLLLLGFIITALIQTSSATVVIVLSALYAHIIPIETAVVIVLGAELGTTVKILIGSLGGIAAKKRVAFGNIFFNVVTSLLGFIFLMPIIKLLRDYIGFHDPVLILVAFQSFINIGGVILFYFFLNPLGDYLDKRFREPADTITLYLQHSSPNNFDTAIEMFEQEIGLFLLKVIALNREVFQIKHQTLIKKSVPGKDMLLFPASLSYEEKYHLLKQSEGAILSFYARMNVGALSKENFTHLNQLVLSLRNAMYAAKGMKDINHNRREFSNSSNMLKYVNYETFRAKLDVFYKEADRILIMEDKADCARALVKLSALLSRDYNEILQNSFNDAAKDILKNVDISSLFNLNLELYSSGKAFVFALKDYLLDAESADQFETNIAL